MMALQDTRSGWVTNSAQCLADLGPAAMAALLRNLDKQEYNPMRLAAADAGDLAKWLRCALKVKTLQDMPLPCHDFGQLLEATQLEYRRLRKLPAQSQAKCMPLQTLVLLGLCDFKAAQGRGVCTCGTCT